MTASWADIFPSEPIRGETAATVSLVANDWRSEGDWTRFQSACRYAAAGNNGHVDPNQVRKLLREQIEPRRLSAFYHRAAGKNGFLEFSHWGINDDARGRNKGKPARIYRLRSGP